MSLEDMPQMQNTQVSQQPDPVSQMPKVDAAQFKNLDDLINGILDELGNKASAAAIAVAGKTTDLVANGVDRVASAASATYDPNFVSAGSPEMSRGNSEDGPGQGRGRDVTDSQQVGASQENSVSMPMRGQQTEQISAALDMSDQDYGTLHPNVSFGKGPSRDALVVA